MVEPSAVGGPVLKGAVVKPPEKPVEADKNKSERRSAELGALLDEHKRLVQKAHNDHPTRPIKFTKMTKDEQRHWNMKRGFIDKTNRVYNQAVRDACERHRAEEATR